MQLIESGRFPELYHATDRSNVLSIKRRGLKPPALLGRVAFKSTLNDGTAPDDFIYLFTRPDFAINVSLYYDWKLGRAIRDTVFLTLRLPEAFPVFLDEESDVLEGVLPAVKVRCPIPAEFITSFEGLDVFARRLPPMNFFNFVRTLGWISSQRRVSEAMVWAEALKAD